MVLDQNTALSLLHSVNVLYLQCTHVFKNATQVSSSPIKLIRHQFTLKCDQTLLV